MKKKKLTKKYLHKLGQKNPLIRYYFNEGTQASRKPLQRRITMLNCHTCKKDFRKLPDKHVIAKIAFKSIWLCLGCVGKYLENDLEYQLRQRAEILRQYRWKLEKLNKSLKFAQKPVDKLIQEQNILEEI